MTSKRWYEEAFDVPYLTVYAHRGEESAAREVAFAVEALGLSAGDPVLDLACGWGRHSRAMARRGLRVAGLDLSGTLLEEARRREGGVGYVRGDMRRIPFRGGFRAVTLFFTSFGYFEHEEDDRRVLAGVAGALLPGGGFLMDYANREQVVRGLVPESENLADGVRVRQRRRISSDGLRVLKEVRIEATGEEAREYVESVRLYSPEEVEGLLSNAGFSIEARYGDLDGGRHGPDSPRLVLLGRLTC